MNTANFYNIPADIASKLDADKDAAAKGFWKYPDADWQFNFDSEWLRARGFTDAAEKAAQCAESN